MNIAYHQYRSVLVEQLGPQKGRVVLLAALMFASIAAQLINPQIIRHFIDLTQTSVELRQLMNAAGAFILIALAHQTLETVATYVSEVISWTSTNSLRAKLVRHCLGLDMAFHNDHTPGEMIERVDGDVNALGNFLSSFIIQILGNILLMFGVLAMLFREDWRAGAAMLAVIVVAITILGLLRNIAVPHWAASRQASADLFGFLEERLAGTEDIRACNGKLFVLRRFYELTRAWYKREVKAALMMNIVFNTSLLLLVIATSAALATGAYLYLEGSLTIGGVYLLAHYTHMLVQPVQRLSSQLQDLQRAGASIGRIGELFETRSSLVEVGVTKLPAGPLSVTLEHVDFGYQKDEQVLDGVTFDLPAGTTLGVLGRTGSGKTTISRLISRLYDPWAGTVRIGGVDVKETTAPDRSDRIAVVTQNVQMFQASIRDNLTLFDPAIADDRIHETLSQLGLRTWMETLPDGLDTVVSSGGEGLSAGQGQLLAFARVLLLKTPDLVILDEASSRLDPATEQLVEQSVDRLLEGRTSIIIAHRLSTLQRTDRVMIIDEGTVVEHGDRATLAADASSRFHSLLKTGLEDVLA